MKNSMHLDTEKHPFTGGGGRSIKPKLAHTVGVGSNPGGEGDKISANASMTKKRPMQGPGTAT